MMTDPIADMLTRIRNGQRVNKKKVDVPHSKVKESILDVLREEGYIHSFEVATNERGHTDVSVTLKYFEGKPVIKLINRKSKPGRRVYSRISDLNLVANGMGINILTTSQGIMSDSKARALNVGGEVICSVL